MEKEIDRIAKNQETDIVIRIDEYMGKKGLTIREFVRSERYSGFTKAGTRIPADKFKQFKAAINMVNEKDLEGATETGTQASAPSAPTQQKTFNSSQPKKEAKKKIVSEEFDEVAF